MKIIIHIKSGSLQSVYVYDETGRDITVMLNEGDNETIEELRSEIVYVDALAYDLLVENAELEYELRKLRGEECT
jgi:hypothetical protein